MFYRSGVKADRSCTSRECIFDLFCTCDLDLDIYRMTFIYELDLYTVDRGYTGYVKMNFLRQVFIVYSLRMRAL